MRVVLIHDSRRIPVDVKPMETVRDLKMAAVDLFAIAPFVMSENGDGLDTGKLKLTHAGAQLQVSIACHSISGTNENWVNWN